MTPQTTSSRGRLLGAIAMTGIVAAMGWLTWRAADQRIEITPVARGAAASSAGATATATGSRRTLAPLASLTETVTRPVFSPTRRPAVPSAPVAAEPVSNIEEPDVSQPTEMVEADETFRLVGVLQRAGAARRVLVRKGDAKAGIWVGEGEMLGSWRVMRIGDAGITLERQGRTRDVKFYSR